MQITRRKFLINGVAGLAQLSITSALVTSLAREANAGSPTIIDVKGLYNLAGDARGIETTGIKKGDTILQSGLANFQPSDVNKVVLVYGSVNGIISKKIGYQTTVKAFISSTKVRLNNPSPDDLYGRTIIGTDDTAKIAKAMQDAAAGAILSFRQGNYMLTQQIPIGMHGGIKICADTAHPATFYNYGFSIAGPNCTVENLNFYGGFKIPSDQYGPYGVYTIPTAAQNNFLIDHCTFTNYDVGVYLAAQPFNTQTGHGTIQENKFQDCRVAILGDAPQSNIVASNTIALSVCPGHGILFHGGANNTIINNILTGDLITGISFLYSHSKASINLVHNNLIASNTITGFKEEGISFDVWGNDAKNVATFEYDTIKSHPTNFTQTGANASCNIQLSSAGWNDAGTVYPGYYMCFLSGNNAGLIGKIVAHTNAQFTVNMSKAACDKIALGDQIVIAAPFFNNTIKNNTLDATKSTTYGIHLYGLCFSNQVTGNTSKGSGIKGAGCGKTAVLAGGIGVRSINGLIQAGTKTPTQNYTNTYGAAPSMNNIFTNNTVTNADLYADFHNYLPSKCPDYMSYGNQFKNNIANGGTIKIDHNQILIS